MRLALILSLLFLVSCSTEKSVVDLLPKVYKMDIQQGNEIDAEMLLKLKPGMTKNQVRFVLGTPLIQDSFHNNRWDYLYAMRKDGKLIEKRHVILNFDKDLLKSITGEVIPKSSNLEDKINPKNAKPLVIHDNKIDESDSPWIDKIKFWEDSPKAKEIKANKKPEEPKPIKKEEDIPSENSDSIKKVDTNDSVNEAVKNDLKSQTLDQPITQELKESKTPLEDKKVIIVSPSKEESDYFKLLLEKIGF